MTGANAGPSWAALSAVWLAGALCYAAWALSRGQDANWDLQNYHDYNAHALLTWRYPLDVGPGGFQSYFNPLPYVVPYLLRHGLPAPWAAAAQAGLQALVVPVAWLLARTLWPAGGVLPLVAAAVGATSAMALSEAGTSLADLVLAAPVLAALLMLLRADAGRGAAWLLAGLLCSAAIGAKPTNAVFVPGLALATLLPWRGWRVTPRAVLHMGAGGLAGVLLTGGAWAAYLQATLGNPVFPAFNTLFRSPSAAPSDFAERSFLTKSWPDALAYPLRTAVGEHPGAEMAYADPRFLLALPLAALALVVLRRDPAAVRAASFLLASYAAWLLLFGIARYALALDVLAGVLLVLLPARMAPGRAALPVALVLALLTVATTRPADWWHRPWSDPWPAVPPPAMAGPAAYLVVFHPIGYWVAALPRASRFYTIQSEALAPGGVLRERMVAGLADPPAGQVRVMGADIPMPLHARAELSRLGFAPAAPCHRAPSLWWIDTVFCAAARVGVRPHAAADLPLDAPVLFDRTGSGWIYLLDGWANASVAGTGTLHRAATLVFLPGATSHVLDVELRQEGGVPGTAVDVLVDGQPAARWRPDGPVWVTRPVCLPPVPGVVRVTFNPLTAAPLPLAVRSLLLRPVRPGEC